MAAIDEDVHQAVYTLRRCAPRKGAEISRRKRVAGTACGVWRNEDTTQLRCFAKVVRATEGQTQSPEQPAAPCQADVEAPMLFSKPDRGEA